MYIAAQLLSCTNHNEYTANTFWLMLRINSINTCSKWTSYRMIRSHFINVTQVLKYKSVNILPNLRDAWVCCTQHISAHSSTPRSQSASAKGMPLRAPCPMMGREVLINQLNGPNLGRQRRETHETTVLQSSRKDSARIISIDPVHPQCRPCLFLLGLSKCSVLMAWNGGHQSTSHLIILSFNHCWDI